MNYKIENNNSDTSWMIKPTDRFVLKWIKMHLSAKITPLLVKSSWLRPWMITVCSSMLGCTAGVVFACGLGWLAGFIAAFAQILDGVDGQFARLTNQESSAGAFLDSVLDRYADGAMMLGLIIYLVQLHMFIPLWLILLLGALALIGSNLISYSSARADSLELNLGKATLANKGTRTSVLILAAWGSSIWAAFPVFALIYLAVHTNCVIISRLYKVK